jgi:phosphorylase kinase gamma subunit
MASTVRRCRQKSTGQMFAVKIVDITTETQSALDVERLMAETHDEIAILRELQGHPSISNVFLIDSQLCNLVELHDVYETTTFIFLVFEM